MVGGADQQAQGVSNNTCPGQRFPLSWKRPPWGEARLAEMTVNCPETCPDDVCGGKWCRRRGEGGGTLALFLLTGLLPAQRTGSDRQNPQPALKAPLK